MSGDSAGEVKMSFEFDRVEGEEGPAHEVQLSCEGAAGMANRQVNCARIGAQAACGSVVLQQSAQPFAAANYAFADLSGQVLCRQSMLR
jgi:hypothetical protein